MLASKWSKENPHALLVGVQTGAATMEISMEIPQQFKNRAAIWPSNYTSRYLSKENKNTIWKKNICTPMFIAVLLTIAKI